MSNFAMYLVAMMVRLSYYTLPLAPYRKRILLVEYNMKKYAETIRQKIQWAKKKIGVWGHKHSEFNSFDIVVVLMRTEIEENIFSYGSISKDITP